MQQAKNELAVLVNNMHNELINSNLQKKYYSLKEVSFITGLSVLALKGRYKRGTLAVVYEGQTPLIPSSEVDRLLTKLERQKTN